MGYKPLPPPSPGIPYYTHLLAHGISPNGSSRCKRCGPTSDRLKCPYCQQVKEHALEELNVRHKTVPQPLATRFSGMTFQQAIDMLAELKE